MFNLKLSVVLLNLLLLGKVTSHKTNLDSTQKTILVSTGCLLLLVCAIASLFYLLTTDEMREKLAGVVKKSKQTIGDRLRGLVTKTTGDIQLIAKFFLAIAGSFVAILLGFLAVYYLPIMFSKPSHATMYFFAQRLYKILASYVLFQLAIINLTDPRITKFVYGLTHWVTEMLGTLAVIFKLLFNSTLFETYLMVWVAAISGLLILCRVLNFVFDLSRFLFYWGCPTLSHFLYGFNPGPSSPPNGNRPNTGPTIFYTNGRVEPMNRPDMDIRPAESDQPVTRRSQSP